MGLRTALGLKNRNRKRWFAPRRSTVHLNSKPPTLPPGPLDEYCASLRGRHCIVFGSAPDPDLSSYDSQPIVCCNGSAASLKRLLGRAPDFSFIHCHVLARTNPADVEVRNALMGVDSIGKAVLLDDPHYSYATDFLAPVASDITKFDWLSRYQMLDDLLGAPLPFLDLSSGAMTAALVLRHGAASVELVGFSLGRKGHSYNPKEHYRNHVRSDAALFALLAQIGYDLRSREPSIAMILTRKIE